MDAPAADLPTAETLAAVLPPDAPRRRRDGWTPPRQRAFLEAIAAGCTIREACRRVGLSTASLYAFRNSPTGGRHRARHIRCYASGGCYRQGIWVCYCDAA